MRSVARQTPCSCRCVCEHCARAWVQGWQICNPCVVMAPHLAEKGAGTTRFRPLDCGKVQVLYSSGSFHSTGPIQNMHLL